jgi:hypothetical protein
VSAACNVRRGDDPQQRFIARVAVAIVLAEICVEVYRSDLMRSR